MQIVNETIIKKIFYGKTSNGDGMTVEPDIKYDNVRNDRSGIVFSTHLDNSDYVIRSPMIGTYQAENITGCIAVAKSIGISTETIVNAVASFKGLRRRMEKRLDGDITKADVTVIDDIAHSPEKARSALVTLKDIYHGKIIVVFEPNIGGRQRESVSKYDGAFRDADMVVIPRLTKLKVNTNNTTNRPLEGDELARVIGKTNTEVSYIDNDQNLVRFLADHVERGCVIAFFGSHGFRGMIEETIKTIGQN